MKQTPRTKSIQHLRDDALAILRAAVEAVQPEPATTRHLQDRPPDGPCVVLAVGKAAWGMASAAREVVGGRLSAGLVVTKDGHSRGPIGGFEILEASHPVPDERSIAAARRALEMLDSRPPEAEVLLLLSGGGSALIELPLPGVTLGDMRAVTDTLLRGGAGITEINTVRKHLSAVKGGRLAERIAPTPIRTVALSDVLGDALDAIASGPAWPDPSTSVQALDILEHYGCAVPDSVLSALGLETPKSLGNVTAHVIGSLVLACEAATRHAQALGYHTRFITGDLQGEASQRGRELGGLAAATRRSNRIGTPPVALVAGGETVVRVLGRGLGGRNQELALAAAAEIAGLDGVVVAAMGTDGTDGPTDAAGGLVDGHTVGRLRERGLRITDALAENDAYHALQASGDLIVTGPTGTNVNDLVIILISG